MRGNEKAVSGIGNENFKITIDRWLNTVVLWLKMILRGSTSMPSTINNLENIFPISFNVIICQKLRH